LFEEIKDPETDEVDKYDFKKRFLRNGILKDDPRLKEIHERLDELN